jgi:hypothetical protein
MQLFGGRVAASIHVPTIAVHPSRSPGKKIHNLLKCNNSISNLHICDSLTNTFDDTGTFVSSNDWESTFGVLARQHVCICVAHAGVVDLYPDLMSARREDLDVFDDKVLAGFPGHGGLAGDGLAFGGRHGRLLVYAMLFLVYEVLEGFRVVVTLMDNSWECIVGGRCPMGKGEKKRVRLRR